MFKYTLILLALSFGLISCNQLQDREPTQETKEGDAYGRFAVGDIEPSCPSDEVVRVLIEWGWSTKYWCYYGSEYNFTIESDQELDIVLDSIPHSPMDADDTAVKDGDNKIVVYSTIGWHRDGFVIDMKRGATLKINGTVKEFYTSREETLETADLGAFSSPAMVEIMEARTVGHPGFNSYYLDGCFRMSTVFGLPQ